MKSIYAMVFIIFYVNILQRSLKQAKTFYACTDYFKVITFQKKQFIKNFWLVEFKN